MRAGKPEFENDYIKKEVEGIPFFIRNNLIDKSFEIGWIGLWRIGQFVVKEL